MEPDVLKTKTESATGVGSCFVSNYPPFSAWSSQQVPAAHQTLDQPAPTDDVPLGLYLHIPFCRKRCRFCYFRVYTDKNSSDVEQYLEALSAELALYAKRNATSGRDLQFVYFGGGTPSFLSNEQLSRLVERIAKHWSWDSAREVTFECEPGTLKQSKIETIKKMGVTRLSLGVEHFNDDVLEINGRAHRSAEIFRSYDWAQQAGFDQVNIDLIAGMAGDTEDRWKQTVATALSMEPDNLTVYQMEVPHNTVFADEIQSNGNSTSFPDWPTKRAWVDYAYDQFEQVGYRVSSGYTLVKPGGHGRFVYRDAIWHGADMIGTGVASFSHCQGVHYQNEDRWEDYLGRLSRGELPIARAFRATDRQRLIRELILQFKLGRVDAGYFRRKFGTEIVQEFGEAIRVLVDDEMATVNGDEVALTRAGLLCVDALLPLFYESQFRGVRYT